MLRDYPICNAKLLIILQSFLLNLEKGYVKAFGIPNRFKYKYSRPNTHLKADGTKRSIKFSPPDLTKKHIPSPLPSMPQNARKPRHGRHPY